MTSLPAFFARNRKTMEYLLAALLFAVAAVNVFTRLGTERLYSWDESRHGVSSCEMMESGNYIVNTYNHQTDYYNVKPVLSFYNNIIGMKIFGRNIFGFRFFSAVCYLLIAGLMYLLLRNEAGMSAALAGTAAFVVLPTNWVHSFRTGDPDATFMLFCFASFVCLWYSVRKGRLLSLSMFFLGLAFLVKSFHVGVPGIFSLTFVACHWKRYSWRDLLSAVAAGAAPVLIWAAFRFHADGWTFFLAMVKLDLLGRLEEGSLAGHTYQPWYAYFVVLNHYLLVIPLAITAGAIGFGLWLKGKKCFSSPQNALGKWALFYFVLSFTFFSFCRFRLKWYIFPSLLFFSIAFGMLFHLACLWIQEESEKKRSPIFFLPPLAIIVASFVWFGIGEGKAIRNLVKADRQRDVLTADQGGDAYRGSTFYCINPQGLPDIPHQKFMLVLRFLDAEAVLKSAEEFRNAPEDTFLICTFDESKDERLRPLAEETASRLSLQLIRYANGEALYRR